MCDMWLRSNSKQETASDDKQTLGVGRSVSLVKWRVCPKTNTARIDEILEGTFYYRIEFLQRKKNIKLNQISSWH